MSAPLYLDQAIITCDPNLNNPSQLTQKALEILRRLPITGNSLDNDNLPNPIMVSEILIISNKQKNETMRITVVLDPIDSHRWCLELSQNTSVGFIADQCFVRLRAENIDINILCSIS